jgi:hypothetical protein
MKACRTLIFLEANYPGTYSNQKMKEDIQDEYGLNELLQFSAS